MLTCLGIVDNDDRRISVESIESSLHSRATASDMQTRCLRSQLLTFAIPTIPTEITPTRMFQLAAALGADADHCGHDGAFYVLSAEGGVLSLFAEGAGGIGVSL